MKQLLNRWNSLPLGWQIVTSLILCPAIIVGAFPVLHAIPIVIAITFLTLSASGYIALMPWPQFLLCISMPYLILIVAALLSPFFVVLDVLKNLEHKK